MQLSISPRIAGRIFGVVLGLLTLISVTGHIWIHTGSAHGHSPPWFLGSFDLDSETNLPTYYQGITLLLSSALLGIIARHQWRSGGPYRKSWLTLSVIFAMLSIDEACLQVHEQLNALMVHSKVAGELRYPWVIPAAIFTLVFGMVYIRFLFVHLSREMRIRFIISGAIYVAGAVGMEFVSGRISDRLGLESLAYQLAADFEELLEMVGIAIFNVTLLRYIGQYLSPTTIVIADTQVAVAGKLVESSPSRPAENYSRVARHFDPGAADASS